MRRRIPASAMAGAVCAAIYLPAVAFRGVPTMPSSGSDASRRHRPRRCTAAASEPGRSVPLPESPLVVLGEGSAVASGEGSAASRWMEEERRLEEEMDERAAADEGTASPPPGGRWESLGGNYVLRPPGGAQPRALLHFLGGAFVGAAPQLAYRYLLERLSGRGYLVVATPYQLSFDHLTTCDEVISRFERAAPALAREYGAVPVVGVGHSCGSLLHVLITSLFPDTPRAANALISYNNRQVGEAVPAFEEVFVPLFSDEERKGSRLIRALIEVVGETYEGKVPSDESILQLLQSIPPPLPGLLALNDVLPPSLVSMPAPIRKALNDLAGPAYEALSNLGGEGVSVPSLLLSSLDVLRQVPKLMDEVDEGARDFVPTPDSASSAARRAYRCRRTLLMQFLDDPLDDSEELEGYLREAESVMRTKRPMITVGLRREVLEGSHVTPLLGPSGGEGWGEALEEALGGMLGGAVGGGEEEGGEDPGREDRGARAVREQLGYEQVERVVEEVVAWLDEGSL